MCDFAFIFLFRCWPMVANVIKWTLFVYIIFERSTFPIFMKITDNRLGHLKSPLHETKRLNVREQLLWLTVPCDEFVSYDNFMSLSFWLLVIRFARQLNEESKRLIQFETRQRKGQKISIIKLKCVFFAIADCARKFIRQNTYCDANKYWARDYAPFRRN